MSSTSGDVEHFYRKKIDAMKADHAAFVERVREITQTLRHWDECEAVTKMIHFEDDAKCTCPRGKLLEVCNG